MVFTVAEFNNFIFKYLMKTKYKIGVKNGGRLFCRQFWIWFLETYGPPIWIILVS